MAFGTCFRLSLSGLMLAALASAATGQQAQPDPEAFRRAQEEANKVPNTPGDGPYSSAPTAACAPAPPGRSSARDSSNRQAEKSDG